MNTITRAIAAMMLVILPISTPAPASDLSDSLKDMTAEERRIFDQQVRRYLLENPEIIREAIRALEERDRQATIVADAELTERYRDEILNDGYSYVGGNPDGDVTIVEFSDYRCGFYKRAHPEIKNLLERDPNVRIVVKELPILGPDSVAAARLALAAHDADPARFGELNDALMGFGGELTEAMAYRIADQVGYDIAELKENASHPEIERKLVKTYELAQRLNLEGTPSFVIGTRIIRGFVPLEEMLASVSLARRTLN